MHVVKFDMHAKLRAQQGPTALSSARRFSGQRRMQTASRKGGSLTIGGQHSCGVAEFCPSLAFFPPPLLQFPFQNSTLIFQIGNLCGEHIAKVYVSRTVLLFLPPLLLRGSLADVYTQAFSILPNIYWLAILFKPLAKKTPLPHCSSTAPV